MADSIAQKTLEMAVTAVKQRHATYGSPKPNFDRITGLWNAYKTPGMDVMFTAADVAIMMALVKVARLMETPDHVDSWVDIAGYAGCGAEVSEKNPT